MNEKIIMLTRKGEPLIYMYNGLKGSFKLSKVIIEEKTNRKAFLKRRIKKLGFTKVFGQLLFQLIIPKILVRISKTRIQELKCGYDLDNTPIPDSISINVSSVNSEECIELLQKEKPDLVIVNGTRIISKKVLNSIDAKFVNTHGGITPKYRGVFGGYWAVANCDKENFGVTTHLVDPGIDTGGVLLQKTIDVTSKDNVITYSYLLAGHGIQSMKKVISDFLKGELKEIEPITHESQLWSTPTLWEYLSNRIRHGAK